MQSENTITYYKEKLLEKGFIDIELKDLYPPLYQELKDISNLKQILLDNLTELRFDLNTGLDKGKEFIEKIQTEFSTKNSLKVTSFNINEREGHMDDLYKIEYKLYFETAGSTKLKEYKDIIHDISRNTFQSWSVLPIDKENFLYPFSRNLVKTILTDFYSVEDGDDKINSPSDITCFDTRDKIISHKDSNDNTYLCVILLYLNDDYQEGDGGELIVEETHKVEPTFGRVVVLDFTNNNVEHEVTEVLTNFQRVAMTTFVSL